MTSEVLKPATNLFMGGNPCYPYEIDGKPFILIDRADIEGDFADVYVIDLSEHRYYTLHWHRLRAHPNRFYAVCDCLDGIYYDERTGDPQRACIHYDVWTRYFNQHIYEPPEI